MRAEGRAECGWNPRPRSRRELGCARGCFPESERCDRLLQGCLARELRGRRRRSNSLTCQEEHHRDEDQFHCVGTVYLRTQGDGAPDACRRAVSFRGGASVVHIRSGGAVKVEVAALVFSARDRVKGAERPRFTAGVGGLRVEWQ